MAETEQITILRLKTEGAESVQDLRDNIKVLKKVIDDTKIGTEEYQQALSLLKVNQNALKDAMYATSASLEDVKNSATGTSESYNGLVHRMAALKEELRNTNVSTEAGKKRFQELAAQVNHVNDRLKEMDALQGNFQRNVGNYQSAFKGLAGYTDSLDKSFKIVGGGLNGLKGGFEAFSKTPAVATIGLLVSLSARLAEELQTNDTLTASLKAGMDALKPVMEFLSGIIENVADFLADIIVKVTSFVTSNGLMDKIVKGVMGVGNAILQYVIAPFKAVVSAIKVFMEEGIKGFKDAAKAFADEYKSGFSFRQNFQTGQTLADTIIAGAKSRAKKSGKEVGTAIREEVEKGLDLDKEVDKALAIADKKLDERLKAREEMSKAVDDWIAADQKALTDSLKEGYDEQLDAFIKEQDEEIAKAKESAAAKKALLSGVADATSSILMSIADMYEADAENSEKSANKVKALRIAAATIDTISGAIGAYMQSVATIPPPAGVIVGAVQAAAVTAAGIAQIAQMKNTQVSASAGALSAAPAPAPAPAAAVVSAPSLSIPVANVRSVTSASEEDRLNQMASDQRVYILSSDIEASQNHIKTQVSESSF